MSSCTRLVVLEIEQNGEGLWFWEISTNVSYFDNVCFIESSNKSLGNRAYSL